MTSIRKTKKEIAYLAGEVITDCYLAIYFQPDEKRNQFIEIITKAANLHNELIAKVNKPADNKNLRKYYRELHKEMLEKFDALFKNISDVCKSE